MKNLIINFVKKYWIFALATGLILAKLSFILWQFKDGGFLVAPGGDQYNHIKYAESLKAIAPNFPYPPLFHFFLNWIKDFWDGDYLKTMRVLAPYFLIAPIIMIYVLTKSLFSARVGLLSLMIAAFSSAYPLYNFADGSYPDLINYGIFIPCVFIFLIRALKNGKWLDIFLSAFFIGLSFFTHHLSSVVLMLILAIYLLILFFNKNFLLNEDRKNLKRILYFYCFFLVFWIIIIYYTFGPSFLSAINNLFRQGAFPVSHIYASKPFEYNEINIIVRPLIEFLGLAGLLVMTLTIGKQKYQNSKILIIVWVIVVWLMSRFEWAGLPPRYLRYLELPLVISAGYFIKYIFSLTKIRMHKILTAGLLGYAIIINSVQLTVPPFLLPDGFYPWVWYRQVDVEKFASLTQNIKDDEIIVTTNSNPYLNYKLDKTNKLYAVRIADIPPCFLKTFDHSAEKEKHDCDKESQDAITNVIKLNKARYIFIGQKPYDIDEKTFAEFTNYTVATDFLKLFDKGKLLKQFTDGSKLYKIDF